MCIRDSVNGGEWSVLGVEGHEDLELVSDSGAFRDFGTRQKEHRPSRVVPTANGEERAGRTEAKNGKRDDAP